MLQSGLLIGDPELLRHVFDRNHRNYVKDTELAYNVWAGCGSGGVRVAKGLFVRLL